MKLVSKMLVARAQANAKPCSVQPLNRQFDFWVGEWTVENPQGQRAGTSSVQLILGDCVVFENWSGAGGGDGKSFNFYNAQKGKWQQTWVDAVGGTVEFTGEYKDGKMLYTAETVAQNTKTLHRMTFFNLSPQTRVRQLWEQSKDRRRQSLDSGFRWHVREKAVSSRQWAEKTESRLEKANIKSSGA